MDPVTLHFHVFQAGAPAKNTHQVDDPRGTTIFALKQQLFSDELKASRSVRFIAGGKILDDSSALEGCKLGKEAHIHVSISNAGSASQQSSMASDDGAASTTTAGEAKSGSTVNAEDGAGFSMVIWAIVAGVAIFVGTGIALFLAFRKRRQYTMHTSQLLFICAAVWVYVLLFHGLPALYQAVNKLGNSNASRDASPRARASSSLSSSSGTTAAAAAPDEAASSSTAAPSPAGMSLMTPTLPPADATTASVLTQRSVVAN